MYYELTKEALRPFWPKATDAVLSGTVKEWPAVAAHYGIDTLFRAAHFWGQITWECGGGTELRENGHYSEDAIIRTFGVGHHSANVTDAEAKALAEKCKTDGGRALFNRVYGIGNPTMAAKLGNTGPDDGWLYRGFDALNSTGREAARWIGKEIGVDLEANPDLANDPGIALWGGAAEYVKLNCLKWADADDTHTETVHINGGANGLQGRIDLVEQFKVLFAKMAKATDAPAPSASIDVPATLSLTEYEIRAIQQGLKDLNYEPGVIDGLWGRRTKQAATGFQTDHDLPSTGYWSADCRVALDVALKEGAVASVSPARATATPADVKAAGVASVSHAQTLVRAGAAMLVTSVGKAVTDANGSVSIDKANELVTQARAAKGWLDSATGALTDFWAWIVAHPILTVAAIGAAAVVYGGKIGRDAVTAYQQGRL